MLTKNANYKKNFKPNDFSFLRKTSLRTNPMNPLIEILL